MDALKCGRPGLTAGVFISILNETVKAEKIQPLKCEGSAPTDRGLPT